VPWKKHYKKFDSLPVPSHHAPAPANQEALFEELPEATQANQQGLFVPIQPYRAIDEVATGT
jgi:hypothetical protein